MLCKAKRLDDNINDFFTENNKYQCEFLPVWGTIGGLFGGWAWGIVMVNNGSANFIGIANAEHTVAFPFPVDYLVIFLFNFYQPLPLLFHPC